jgi:curli biogenesis system outer membrane secretion channel CsgG
MFSQRIPPALLFALVLLTAACAATAESEQPLAVVAVWDLENLNPADPAGAEMGEFLSAAVIETIRESNRYTVVERERLVLALEELNLSSGDLASEETRLRLGKILGAGYMVFGSYMVLGSQMRLDLRLVEVQTGKIVRAGSSMAASADPAAWLKTARATAEKLL